MKARRPKCPHCPLAAESGPCHGQFNLRVCTLEDPASPHYEPGKAALVMREPEGPGLLARAVNFAGALVDHVKAGMPEATPEVRAARLAICRSNECGFYRENQTCAHAGCGCFLEIKVGWADQSCPRDPPMWGPVKAE